MSPESDIIYSLVYCLRERVEIYTCVSSDVLAESANDHLGSRLGRVKFSLCENVREF